LRTSSKTRRGGREEEKRRERQGGEDQTRVGISSNRTISGYSNHKGEIEERVTVRRTKRLPCVQPANGVKEKIKTRVNLHKERSSLSSSGETGGKRRLKRSERGER